MGQIRVLPSGLVSRIAAGECIERPASVIKELVENALDAGATRVDLRVVDGGRELIEVVDDGVGMDADDLALSVAQHATSKIRGDDDLFNIQTLGFRGEALASIAAVSRLRIVSRTRDSDVGHEIWVEGGQVRGPRPCSAPPGTTVEVRDLFYPVPARRKFLRTPQTEMGHITEQLARIAIPQLAVAFTLRHRDRVIHRLEVATDHRERVSGFYGPELAQALLPIRREGTGMLVQGLVGPPAETRSAGKWEYVFVNGRYVRDRFISHAIREAYRGLIDPSRYPVAFIFLTIEPARVDVNVHPTKIEVRWQDSNYVHGMVLAAIRERFLTSPLDHRLRTPQSDEDYRERVRTAMVEFFRRGPVGPCSGTEPRNHGAAEPPSHEGGGAGRLARQSGGCTPGVLPSADSPGPATNRGKGPPPASLAAPACPARPAPVGEPNRPPTDQDESGASLLASAGAAGRRAAPDKAPPRAIQIHDSYLVVQTEEGLMIIDQHALHERLLYEDLRGRIAENKLVSQRLLMPSVLPVPGDRLEVLEAHADLLARLGIELTAAGPHSVALQSFPALLADRVDPEDFLRDLLDVLVEQGGRPDPDTLIHQVLDLMACKAAVKAGEPLNPQQIALLVEQHQRVDRSSHCPHGRPTTLRLSLRDLERQFKRR